MEGIWHKAMAVALGAPSLATAHAEQRGSDGAVRVQGGAVEVGGAGVELGVEWGEVLAAPAAERAPAGTFQEI